MFKDYDRKRDVRLFALPSFHQTLRCNRHCPPSTKPCAATATALLPPNLALQPPLPSFHQTLRCNLPCPPSIKPCAATAFHLTAQQVDDVRRFGDKGTFFTGHDILDHGHRRKPQTFDG
jgi:hypothetical protein